MTIEFTITGSITVDTHTKVWRFQSFRNLFELHVATTFFRVLPQTRKYSYVSLVLHPFSKLRTQLFTEIFIAQMSVLCHLFIGKIANKQKEILNRISCIYNQNAVDIQMKLKKHRKPSRKKSLSCTDFKT